MRRGRELSQVEMVRNDLSFGPPFVLGRCSMSQATGTSQATAMTLAFLLVPVLYVLSHAPEKPSIPFIFDDDGHNDDADMISAMQSLINRYGTATIGMSFVPKR
jgi:hypothetical protein